MPAVSDSALVSSPSSYFLLFLFHLLSHFSARVYLGCPSSVALGLVVASIQAFLDLEEKLRKDVAEPMLDRSMFFQLLVGWEGAGDSKVLPCPWLPQVADEVVAIEGRWDLRSADLRHTPCQVGLVGRSCSQQLGKTLRGACMLKETVTFPFHGRSHNLAKMV